ncbi:MAG: T9SS type A sorting domain-containing protein, partial [Candidatus Marinimicrobia bacterium]|nr:T9SS type A sorting domain-containing protein [Candidatus Neomarinimicrobiota bacterium]
SGSFRDGKHRFLISLTNDSNKTNVTVTAAGNKLQHDKMRAILRPVTLPLIMPYAHNFQCDITALTGTVLGDANSNPGAIAQLEYAANQLNEDKDDDLAVSHLANLATGSPHLEMIEIGKIRGMRLARLELQPVMFDTASGQVLAITSVELEIDPDQAWETVPSRLLSKSYKRVFNYLFRSGMPGHNVNTEAQVPDHLLIIAQDSVIAAIQPLATWKRQKGFKVTVTPISEAGHTANEIKAYVDSAYGDWPEPPSYLLLAGNTAMIPTFEGIRYPAGEQPAGYPTDLYFGTMDDQDDYIPDIIVGRLPAESAQQLSGMVNKAIRYEFPDPADQDWRDHAAFIATGDPDYHGLVEDAHRYAMTNYFLPGNSDIDSIWAFYGAGNEEIQMALTTGSNVICYSGHGTKQLWWHSYPAAYFGLPELMELPAGSAFPLVLSLGCEAGHFGTDDVISLGESFLQLQDRGASAFWGASNPTFWYEDDYLERRFWDAAFSGYLSSLGEMTVAALLDLFRRGYTRHDYYFEVYNILGDPTMEFSMGGLDSLSVSHQDTIPVHLSSLLVNVTAIDGAAIDSWCSLEYDGTIISQAIIYAGQGELKLPSDLLFPGDNITLTVLKNGYLPYLDTIYVTDNFQLAVSPDSIPVMVSTNITVDASSQNVTMPAGSFVKLNGYTFSEPHILNLDMGKSCSTQVTPLYGEELLLQLVSPGDEVLAETVLYVDEAPSVTINNFISSSHILGISHYLVPGFPGELYWQTDLDVVLSVRGAGIDSAFTGSSANLFPAFEDTLRCALLADSHAVAIVTVPVIPAWGSTSITVLDVESGSPIEGGAVTLSSHNHVIPLFSGLTGSQGVMAFTDEMPVDYYTVEMQAGGYHQLLDTLLIRPGINDDTLLVTPVLRAQISGVITTGGNPLAGATLWLRGQDLHTISDSTGGFQLPPVQPGILRLSIMKRGHAITDTSLMVMEGEIISGLAIPLCPGPMERLFTFEDDDEGFNQGGDWAWGAPGIGLERRGPNQAFSGTKTVGTVLDGPYIPYSNSSLVSAPLYLDGFEHVRLTFYHYVMMTDQPGYDGGNIKISPDGGINWEWENVSPLGGYPVDSMYYGSYLATQPAFSGRLDGWQPVQIDLSEYLSRTDSIMIRFHFSSTSREEDDGWYLDDISLQNSELLFASDMTNFHPGGFYLFQNYPNPFNGVTKFIFSLGSPGPVQVSIYNLLGHKVVGLSTGFATAGPHELIWNGHSELGIPVASGVYIATVRADSRTVSRLITVLR